MKLRLILICLLGFTAACTGSNQQTQQTQTSQPQENKNAQTPVSKEPGADFQVTVAAIERVRQWQPKTEEISGGAMNIRLTRGASLVSINGSLSGFQPESSAFELVVVHLEIKRLSDGAKKVLGDVEAEDDKGKKYSHLVGNPKELGQAAAEKREFAFAVPKGSALKKLYLTKDWSVELK